LRGYVPDMKNGFSGEPSLNLWSSQKQMTSVSMAILYTPARVPSISACNDWHVNGLPSPRGRRVREGGRKMTQRSAMGQRDRGVTQGDKQGRLASIRGGRETQSQKHEDRQDR